MLWQPKNCVVVPVDFSESAAPAVREAIRNAKDPAAVRVLHVLPHLDALSPGAVWNEVSNATRLKHATNYMQNFLSENDLHDVQPEILIGDPGIQIAEYAEANNADLIVIPSHGYHGVKHLILGSVAERVIRHAHCSVLVTRRHDAN